MALHTPPTNTPDSDPEDNKGTTSANLVRNYMLRQYWSMKWLLLTLVSIMSAYTIHFERWIPGIGLTGLSSFFMIMLGLLACGTIMNTEFLKAIRAKQLENDFDWTKVRYAAWGLVAGNLVMFYWGIVMAYVTWFAENPVNIQ